MLPMHLASSVSVAAVCAANEGVLANASAVCKILILVRKWLANAVLLCVIAPCQVCRRELRMPRVDRPVGVHVMAPLMTGLTWQLQSLVSTALIRKVAQWSRTKSKMPAAALSSL